MLRTIAYLLLDQLFQPVKMRFCCHLADTLHHSSIKVYLSAIQPHHIEKGLPSPLVGVLLLQGVFRGIKRHQGSNKRQLGMELGAHGWVVGICQPWGQHSIKGMAGHRGSPWVSQALTFHLSEAVG